MNGLRSDHWTISGFRRENETAFASIIKMFRRFLVDNKYSDASKIVFDGSKMKAYASRDMLTKQGIMKKLENIDATVKEFMEGIEAIDSIDAELERKLRELEEVINDRKSVENDKESIEWERDILLKEKESILRNIEKVQKKQRKLEYANELIENTGEKYIAPNDPEAVLVHPVGNYTYGVKSRDGKVAGYNIQTGVDEKGLFIFMLPLKPMT